MLVYRCANYTLGLGISTYGRSNRIDSAALHSILKRRGKLHAIALCALVKHRRNGRMQRDAVAFLFPHAAKPAVAGHAHRIEAGPRRIAPARLPDPVGLTQEIMGTAERRRIVQRHEYRGAPTVCGIGPTVPG